jgi:hypothetical protein
MFLRGKGNPVWYCDRLNLNYLLLRFFVESFASVPIKTGIPEIIKDGIRAYVIKDIAVLKSNKNNLPNNTQPKSAPTKVLFQKTYFSLLDLSGKSNPLGYRQRESSPDKLVFDRQESQF